MGATETRFSTQRMWAEKSYIKGPGSHRFLGLEVPEPSLYVLEDGELEVEEPRSQESADRRVLRGI
jgi:hypothetical protein